MKIVKFNKELVGELAALCLFILLFIGASVFAWLYGDVLQELLRSGGMLFLFVYFLFSVAAEVVAPISSLPALPLAVSIWGSFLAAIVSWVGWLTGSIIAFALARRFGQPLVGRLVNLAKVQEASRFIPQKNLFWLVVFLRLFFPTDIFSYALGLFTAMRWSAFFWATAIGLAPFSFIFAYGLKVPIGYQIAVGFTIIAITILFYRRARKKVFDWVSDKFKG